MKEAQLKLDPTATDGTFAKGSYVKNIRAIFGRTAQVKKHAMLSIPEEYYDELKLRWEDKFFEGPSIGAVKDASGDLYHIDIQNVTLEGYKYNADKPILTGEDTRPGSWGRVFAKWKEDRGIQ